MVYSISTALEVLPKVFIAILAVVFIALEIKRFREQLFASAQPDPGREGFVPPKNQKDGYEYYVGGGTIVYISKGGQSFKIYVISGQAPACAKVRKDRTGRYFTVRAASPAEAEDIIDRAYRKETK